MSKAKQSKPKNRFYISVTGKVKINDMQWTALLCRLVGLMEGLMFHVHLEELADIKKG